MVEGLQALFNQDNGTGRIVNLGAQVFTKAGGSLASVPRRIRSRFDALTRILGA